MLAVLVCSVAVTSGCGSTSTDPETTSTLPPGTDIGSSATGDCPEPPPTCAGECADGEACVDDACIAAVVCDGDYSTYQGESLANVIGCTHITGSLAIYFAKSAHLEELHNLTSVDGALLIIDNDQLVDLDGLGFSGSFDLIHSWRRKGSSGRIDQRQDCDPPRGRPGSVWIAPGV